MVEIKHLIRGRSQNKIFSTHGKNNSSSPLHAAAEAEGPGGSSAEAALQRPQVRDWKRPKIFKTKVEMRE